MDANKTKLILGPPGTGKTTTLLKIVERKLDEGLEPEDIAFVSFTRKAAHEAMDRARAKFGFDRSELPWFRTLHSLAFHQLQLRSKDVMGVRDYLDLAKALKIHVTLKGISEDGTLVGLSKGDRMFFSINLARVLGRELQEWWRTEGRQEDIAYYELERVARTIDRYKEKYGKVDFTDVIERFCHEKPAPDIKVLVVDEAQDLAPTQWKMVEVLAEKAQEVYVAGDDDQAIFKWAGADVDHFIRLEGEATVLDQSWRVPSKIALRATALLQHVRQRRNKQWNSRPEEGILEFTNSPSTVDLAKGSWYLLGRNSYLLEEFQHICLRQGFLFESSIGSPVKPSLLGAIRSWERLRKGKTVRASEVVNVYRMMSTRIGVKHGYKSRIAELDEDRELSIHDLKDSFGLMTFEIWHKAFDRLKDLDREYLLAALRRGEKVSREPRIRISTIHGVKGGQADNVVLLTDMAQRTYKEFQSNPDDEFRVWYVAATRAKERLIVVDPRTSHCFDFKRYANHSYR